MSLAWLAAAKSKDLSTRVGCVMVGPDNEIRSTGYNGLPRGVNDGVPERFERPAKYLWTSHAEENAVAQAARVGIPLKGCQAYITHYPCARCSRALIQAGITTIIVGNGQVTPSADVTTECTVSRLMFKETGMRIRHV